MLQVFSTRVLVNQLRQYYDAGPGVVQSQSGVGPAALYEDFLSGQGLDPRITFSRTSNATLTGSNGLIQYAPHNLLTYSEQFDNAAWTKSNGSVTANDLIAPNGTTTGDSFTITTQTAVQGLTPTTSFTANGASPYTFSIYIKKATTPGVDFLIYFRSAIGAGSQYSVLNANTFSGFVSFSAGSSTSSNYSAVDAGDWWRFSITAGGIPAGSMNAHVRLNNIPVGATVGVWGAQLNVDGLQSYNPTTVKNLLGYTQEFDNAAWTKNNSFIQTNLLTYSQQFTNAAWLKTNVLSTGDNEITAPDGSLTGANVYVDSAATPSTVLQSYTASTASYTFSVWLNTVNMPSDASIFVTVDGTNYTQVTGWTTNDVWFRTTVTGSVSAGVLSAGIRTTLPSASGALGVWGAQLVQGATAGDYQTTYGAAKAVMYTAPDGSLSADKLVENTAASGHNVLGASVALIVGTPYAGFVYAKAAERTQVAVTLSNAFTSPTRSVFDLSSGTVVSSTASVTSATITAVGNGWYLCGISSVCVGAAAGQLIVQPASSGNISYTGDGTSGIYIWGAQLSDSASVDPYVYNPVAAPTAAAYYGPRFDYDPVTLAPKGLLIEEQRTNLLLNSDTLATQNVTVTAVAHTLSFYGTGTVTLSGVSTAGPLIGTGAYPNQVTLTFTPTAGTLTLTVTGSVRYAQLEAGAFATSYIPTVASQVTRAADSAIMQGANFSNWYNQNNGTLFAESSSFGTAAVRYITNYNDSTATNRMAQYFSTSSYIGLVTTGGATQANMSIAGTALVKHALAYATNDFITAANGALSAADTSGTVPVLSQLNIGSSPSATSPINGHIRRIAYYNRRLANSELQGITS